MRLHTGKSVMPKRYASRDGTHGNMEQHKTKSPQLTCPRRKHRIIKQYDLSLICRSLCRVNNLGKAVLWNVSHEMPSKLIDDVRLHPDVCIFAARRQLRNTRQFFAEQKKRYRPQAGEAAKPSFRVHPRGRQPNEAAGAIRSRTHEQIIVQACSCARAPKRRVEVRGSFAIHHTIIDHVQTG